MFLKNHEKRVMYSKSDNIEIMIKDKEDKVREELFQLLLSRYQVGLKTSMKGSDWAHLLYYKCHKIRFRCNRVYIDSPHWIKSKNPTINSINRKKNEYFQCAVTTLLNNEEIKKYQRITKNKPFMDKYHWEGINHPFENDDLKNLRKII